MVVFDQLTGFGVIEIVTLEGVAQYSDYKGLGWLSTRLIERMLGSLDPAKTTWEWSSMGYHATSPVGRLVSVCSVGKDGDLGRNSCLPNLTKINPAALETTKNLGFGGRYDEIMTVEDYRFLEFGRFYKSMLLLIVEYMYKIVFDTDYRATITEALGRQPSIYKSEAMQGLTLTVSYPGGAGVNDRLKMEDVGIAVSRIVFDIGRHGGSDQWRTFTGWAMEKKDRSTRFMKLVISKEGDLGANGIDASNITAIS